MQLRRRWPVASVLSRARYSAASVTCLFSDTTASRIMKWEEGKVSVFRENSTGPSGLTFDHQGRLLACERGRVTRTEKNGKITVLADHLHAPHDLVYAIDGSIYFSDSALDARKFRDLPDHAPWRGAGRIARLRTSQWRGAGAESAEVVRRRYRWAQDLGIRDRGRWHAAWRPGVCASACTRPEDRRNGKRLGRR